MRLRPVTIVADDYGIGRETSRAILELAMERRITATVLIVNAPDAERAAREWLAASPDADLGWHPNLTLDRPISRRDRIPSLVRPDGSFWQLPNLLRRFCLGRIAAEDIRTEFAAQYRRFEELVGRPPAVVNSHQHVSLLPPCDDVLLDVLDEMNCRPYLRRVVEKGRTLTRVAGDRVKRTFLSLLGRRAARRAAARGLPGCDTIVGLSNNRRDLDRCNWPTHTLEIGSIEIYGHPGHRDESLIGRDCWASQIDRRPRELELLRSTYFRDSVHSARLSPIRPSELATRGR